MTTIEAPTSASLESGDRLTRDEFERRYAMHPEIKKAELINGVVYVASPVSLDHSAPEGCIAYWLSLYWQGREDEIEVSHNGTLRLGPASEPQPDVFLRSTRSGRSHRGEDGFLVGIPELVVEIARSSASYDLHDKKDVYEAAGIPEYIVWRVEDTAIDWFVLRDGRYQPLPRDERGVVHSEVFPGLRLAVDAMVARNLRAVREVMQPTT